MVNQEELIICRRRGHVTKAYALEKGWVPCSACGVWVREKRVLEEREDGPPESELDPGVRTDRKIDEIRRKLRS